MLAAPATSGVTWSSVVAAAVFLVVLIVLAADRVRMKRRLARAERSEASLQTDLADAGREIDALRGALRQQRAGERSGLQGDRPGGGPPAPVL